MLPILNSQISTEKRLETLVCLVRTCNKMKVRFFNLFSFHNRKTFLIEKKIYSFEDKGSKICGLCCLNEYEII